MFKILVVGTSALKSEIEGIVERSLNDPRTVSYVSELLISPPISEPEIKLNWIGLHYSESNWCMQEKWEIDVLQYAPSI